MSPKSLLACPLLFLVAASSIHAASIYTNDFSGSTVGATPTGWSQTGAAGQIFQTVTGTTATVSGTERTILGGTPAGPGNYAYWDSNTAGTNSIVATTSVPANAQLQLGVGQTVAYSFSWVGAADVFGSAAGYPTGATGFGQPMVFAIYGANGGYQVQVGLGTGNTTGSIRVGTVSSTGGTFTQLNATTTGASTGLLANTLYSMNLSLTRVDATTMSIIYGVSGGTVNFTSTPVTTTTGASDFSGGATLQIGNGNTRPAFGFDNVNLDVVPEPSSLLLGGLGLLGLLRRRRN